MEKKVFKENFHSETVNPDFLLSLGVSIWSKTYKLGKNEREVDKFLSIGAFETGHGNTLEELVHATTVPHWAAKWVHCGAPRLSIDGKFASMLMATDVKSDMVDFVKVPWDTFLVEIKEDILFINAKDGVHPIGYILVSKQCNGKWTLVIQSKNSDDRVTGKNVDFVDTDFSELHNIDQKSMLLAQRLIPSLCLAMSDPTCIREQKRTKGRGTKFRMDGGPPIRTFIVGKPITIDCRKFISDYVHSEDKTIKPVSVQTLVRGHWKTQKYGIGRSLQKIIHIEPYWRGPDDAPVIFKPTIVK